MKSYKPANSYYYLYFWAKRCHSASFDTLVMPAAFLTFLLVIASIYEGKLWLSLRMLFNLARKLSLLPLVARDPIISVLFLTVGIWMWFSIRSLSLMSKVRHSVSWWNSQRKAMFFRKSRATSRGALASPSTSCGPPWSSACAASKPFTSCTWCTAISSVPTFWSVVRENVN